MLVLGFESSCDETSCAVLEMDEKKGIRKVLSNVVASQVDIHRLYGGVVPEIAGRAHIEAVSGITYSALENAGVKLRDIELVAVTSCPGLIGALLVGVNFAKSLAYSNKIPLVGVNHVRGHVSAALLDFPTLVPPFLALVVSGGHTSFYSVKSFTDYTEIGSTGDDAAGEAFDKIGRVIGMPYPGGAAMDKLAYEGEKTAIKFPSPALVGDNLNFSFSGIKTAALNYINGERLKGNKINEADVAASYVYTIVKAIAKKTDMALERTGYRSFVLAGGVAANSHLRRECEEVCRRRGVKFCVPDIKLCGDNAAMIAASGYYEYLDGKRDGTSLNASACE